MSEVLKNLLETNPDNATETYYHGTSKENFRNMVDEGGLRSNNRENCELEPGTQIVKEDIIRILQQGPNPRDNQESVVEDLYQPSHFKLDSVGYVEANQEEFEKHASEASLRFIEGFEDFRDMREEFEDSVMEFRGPANGVHLHEVTSLAKSSEAVELYGDLTLEIRLPENSTYSINGYRVPGIIPIGFVNTVYGPKETVKALEENFGDEYGIEYSELSSI